jgi:hypothetical protein
MLLLSAVAKRASAAQRSEPMPNHERGFVSSPRLALAAARHLPFPQPTSANRAWGGSAARKASTRGQGA